MAISFEQRVKHRMAGPEPLRTNRHRTVDVANRLGRHLTGKTTITSTESDRAGG